jgi:predicted regulator of Ras-like GTPase activity (Roadblock/LC7/MglB family)
MPVEYRSEALLRSLAALHQDAPEIHGSAVFTHDGLVIASYPPGWDADIHAPTGGENVAAMASVVVGMAVRTLTRLDQGGLQRVLLEGERGAVGVFPATADTALAVLIPKDAHMGLVLHAARQAADRICAILDNR